MRPDQSLRQPLCMFTESARAKNHRGVDVIPEALAFGRL